jgi:DNA replication and repair protein RecF
MTALPSPVPPVRLAVTRLVLTEFRSYADARLSCDPRPVVLTGPNGAGKTNLLEAVSFLSPGRGLRRARLADVQRVQAPEGRGWAVAATVHGASGPVDLGTGRDPSGGERRLVRVEGEPARGQAALAEHAAVAWLTPQMDRLFQEGPGARRRFLDRLVFGFDPAHAGRLTRYDRALRERARLLREGPPDPVWLAALEAEMAGAGVAVAAARRDVLGRVARAAAEGVGPFPAADIAVEGPVEAILAERPAVAAEDAVRDALARGRRADAESGTTAVGPHRSDMAVRHRAKDMPADRCSTGEQKALLIAIVLATSRVMAAERGAAPVLLLDEVAAHLDEARREALFAALLELGGQAWLTGTDAATFAPLGDRAQHWRVEDGRLSPA